MRPPGALDFAVNRNDYRDEVGISAEVRSWRPFYTGHSLMGVSGLVGLHVEYLALGSKSAAVRNGNATGLAFHS